MISVALVVFGFSLFTLLYIIVILRKNLFLVRVDGTSMLPTLQQGDFLLVKRCKPAQQIRKGQIIVWRPLYNHPARDKLPFRSTEIYFIKRIIGMPGDDVILNHFARTFMETRMETSIQVPIGHCFVQGDSPGYDSHVIGPVPLDWIQGVVVFRIGQQNISHRFSRSDFD